MIPTLLQRQVTLRKELKDAKKNALRLRNNKRARVNYRKRKTKPWRDIRAAWAEHRRAVAERKAQRLAKKAAKLEAKRLREAARERKHHDPVRAWQDAFRKGVEAGRILERSEQNDKKS